MGWFKKQVNQGQISAPHPNPVVGGYLPCNWSLDPEQIPAIMWWTKWPVSLIQAFQTWLMDFIHISVVQVSVVGWVETEKNVPPYQEQLEAIRRLVGLIGPERVIWRYSPIPDPFNMEKGDILKDIAYNMWVMGIRSCYIRTLDNDRLIGGGGANKTRIRNLGIAKSILVNERITPTTCREDLALDPSYEEARCIDAGLLNTLCGCTLTHSTEKECGCAVSVDPGCGIPCKMGCTYCYAKPRNQ